MKEPAKNRQFLEGYLTGFWFSENHSYESSLVNWKIENHRYKY